MDATHFRTTFGIEIEFIVCYNPEAYKNKLWTVEGILWPMEFTRSLHHRFGILVRQHMIQILNENGFPTNGYQSQDFSKWTVYTDDTVHPIHESENWYAIEVKTPALDYSREALEQVEKVVELLVSRFNLYTNEHCGLHVHVGNGDRGFDLRTLKNFCSLITVFDCQLDSLHPPDRLRNPHVKSTRRVFSPGTTPQHKLFFIENLEAIDGLIQMFHYTVEGEFSKHMAFNFFNLLEFVSVTHPLRTIESRQHRGTLDPKLITNWAKVVCNLVALSYSDQPCFRLLIDEHIDDDTMYTAVDLLTNLKLFDSAEFYAPRVYPQCESAALPGPDHIDLSAPGIYETAWEKEFAPRPPSELRPTSRGGEGRETPSGSYQGQ